MLSTISVSGDAVKNKTVKKTSLPSWSLLILATSLWHSCFQYLFTPYTRNCSLLRGGLVAAVTEQGVGARARAPNGQASKRADCLLMSTLPGTVFNVLVHVLTCAIVRPAL